MLHKVLLVRQTVTESVEVRQRRLRVSVDEQ